jgi:hypothetical protein
MLNWFFELKDLHGRISEKHTSKEIRYYHIKRLNIGVDGLSK